MESSSQSSENHELDSPSPGFAATTNKTNQENVLFTGDLDDLPLKDSLVSHEKQSKAPEIMPECMMPVETSLSSDSHESNSPGLAPDFSPSICYQQSSLLPASGLHDNLPSQEPVSISI